MKRPPHISVMDVNCSVSTQIAPDDLAPLAAAGVRLVVNNRPDDEEPGQPAGAAIAAAAAAAGLAYAAIPIAYGFNPASIEAMQAALAAPGPMLAYCKSGTRSAMLWALARAADGAEPAALTAIARAAGFDLIPLAPALAAQARAAAPRRP